MGRPRGGGRPVLLTAVGTSSCVFDPNPPSLVSFSSALPTSLELLQLWEI